jgi:hypothetical protein
MGSSTKLLREYISEIINEPQSGSKRLRVFDFDDTLVRTDAKVHVTDAAGQTFDLAPGEFAVYDKQPGDTFSYEDFEQLVNPRTIRWTCRILQNVYAHHGPKGVVVLSARGVVGPIEQFLNDVGLVGVEVAALGDPSPQAKSGWISKRIDRDGLDMVEYFDDSHKNVAAVRALQPFHPDTEIVTRLVAHHRVSSLYA